MINLPRSAASRGRTATAPDGGTRSPTAAAAPVQPPPVVTAKDLSAQAGQAVAASGLIAGVKDPAGLPVVTYRFMDNGSGGGHFVLNGKVQASGQWITVAAADLAKLSYVGSATGGQETLSVAASDGRAWSAAATATATTVPPPPVVIAKGLSAKAGQGIAASELIASATDPAGLPITAYRFMDNGGGGGHFLLNGKVQASGQWITVAAADLAKLSYVGSATGGQETLSVAASDGRAWSAAATATATTVTPPPVVTAQDLSVEAGQAVAASGLIASATDPAGQPITAYRFMDNGGGGGHFVLDGTVQASGRWITVAAADLAKLSYVGSGTGGRETLSVAASDGRAWSASATATATTTDTMLDKLTDAGVHDDVARLMQNDTLSYASMLTVLQDADKGGISASEFSSLQALAGLLNAPGGIQTSDYVDYITKAVVDGNPANATWTASQSSPQSLGDLAAGSSEDQADKLTGKWFLGSDTPTFSGYDHLNWAWDPLFSAQGPQYTDANQGALGDCYLIASLGEIALQDNDTIQSMFTDNGNDTWGVRFFDASGKAEYVTVDDWLPAMGGNWASGSNWAYANGTGSKWAELAEKAYAQLNEEGGLPRWAGNSYDLLTGGYADPVTEITGKPTFSCSPTDPIGAQALAQGQEVLLATPDGTSMPNLIGGHMFEVTAYDAGTGAYTLHNPWGSAVGGGLQVTFNATPADLAAQGAWLYVSSGTSLGHHAMA